MVASNVLRAARRDLAGRWFAESAGVLSDGAADAAALERLLHFMCVSQLYLRDNLRLDRALEVEDIKSDPSGHWGVCPPTNHLLAALAPLVDRVVGGVSRLRILHGAGHAGPSLRAWTYLSGELGGLHPRYERGSAGYRALIEEFPGPLGGEVTPLLPGVDYMGGQLGPALAYGQGVALGSPDLVIPVVGDGECETGETASAWLAGRCILGPEAVGLILPVVLLNGFRMGSRSLLSQLSINEVRKYFLGFGYRPVYVDGSSVERTRTAIVSALRMLAAPTPGLPPVLLLTMLKGMTGPAEVAGQRMLGTAKMHKAPLTHPRENPALLSILDAWLRSYDPASLLDRDLRPLMAVPVPRIGCPVDQATQAPAAQPTVTTVPPGIDFRVGVFALLENRASAGRFRVFSPDEFSSTLQPCSPGSALERVLIECLNEQLCHCWLEGFLAAGGTGILVGYEGFAGLTATHLSQYAKKMHLHALAGRPPLKSVTYLLSSTCWENSYSHQDPTLTGALLCQDDPLVRVFTPATVEQCLVTLDHCLDDFGRVNVVVAGKRASPPRLPLAAAKLSEAWSVWDGSATAPPRLALVAIGNSVVAEMQAAQERLRQAHPALPVLLASVNDLSVLTAAHSPLWSQLGSDSAVLVATALHAAPIRSLVERALPGRRIQVVGFRDPGAPMSGPALLRHCGCDADSLVGAALQLIAQHDPSTRRTA